jgi:outer membrane protein TolC
LASFIHLRLAAGVVLAFCAWPTFAQSVHASQTTTLRDAVESAWQHRLSSNASQDRIRRARAAGVAAASWFADAPALELSSRSDRWASNQGTREREVGIRLPLWLPGQRQARIAAADAELSWAQATQAADKLKLAGEVRERAWEVHAARASLEQAEAQARSTKALAQDASRRQKAGEIASTEMLELQAEALSAEGQVHEARAKLASAQAQWSALTGQGTAVVPDEPLHHVAPPTHPALRAAELMVERAARSLDDVRRSLREPPELGVGLRYDRGERQQPVQASVVIGLRWPFATDARNEPRLAAAQGELDAALAEAATLAQQVAAERNSAAAALLAAEAQLTAARQRSELLQRRAASVSSAFKAGEAGLPEEIRASADAVLAAAAAAQQQAVFGLARARVNQSLGILP